MNEDFESYSIEDNEDEEVKEPSRRLTMWTIMPQIMITPAAGWEKAKKFGPTPELATLRFLFPLCLLSGVSVFFALLYPRHNGLGGEESRFTVLLVNSVIQFCSFFIGYYVALVLNKVFLPKDVRDFPSTSFGKLLVMTGISTLALFHIIFEVLPMLDFILVFLPLWTIFIIYKGLPYSGMHSEKKLLAIGTVCVTTILGPFIVEWILVLFA